MTRLYSSVAGAIALGLTIACSPDAPVAPQVNQLEPPLLAAQNSEQVIFSGVATTGSAGGPVGFWIWCEAESSNPYEEECNGAMYFYSSGITRHVEGDVTENPPNSGIYEMLVSSTLDTPIQDCTLKNVLPTVHGPHNTVTVSCVAPAGSWSTTTAVVNVTGP